MTEQQTTERAVLCALDTGRQTLSEAEAITAAVSATGWARTEAEVSLEELRELTRTAGAEVVGTVLQVRPSADAALYLGTGKIEELKEMVDADLCDLLIFDGELSPTQLRNIEKATGARVIDRTTLILDIFAQRARSREGRLQVELAQLQYRLPRLAGQGTSLSRLGAGIGTRGPGETKLETDRRVIQRRIKILSDNLEAMKRARDTARKKRSANSVPTVAIVGYTNAGKSTLLNRLTGSEVLSEDKLFATLDPTTRAAELPDGQQILFTDTVGFINKLPHNLVDAFRSTLEEAGYSDIILHVIDASDPQAELHRKVVYDTLADLGITDKPVITVWNKADLVEEGALFRDFSADASLKISAKTGEGVDDLYREIAEVLKKSRVYIDEVIPYRDAARVAEIRRQGQLISEEYEEDGVHVKAYVPRTLR